MDAIKVQRYAFWVDFHIFRSVFLTANLTIRQVYNIYEEKSEENTNVKFAYLKEYLTSNPPALRDLEYAMLDIREEFTPIVRSHINSMELIIPHMNIWDRTLKQTSDILERLENNAKHFRLHEDIDEIKLIEKLMKYDISTMLPVSKIYWIYNLLNLAIIGNNTNFLIDGIKEIYKDTLITKEYMDLFEPPRLKYIDKLLLPVLTSICRSYYGLIDRDLFTTKLIALNSTKINFT